MPCHTDIDQDNYNLCLIKAIQLYVHANCKPELREAEMHLTLLDTKNKNNSNNNRRRAEMSTSALLKSFSMVERPMSKQWLDIGTFADTPVNIFMEDTLSKGGGKSNEDGGGDGGNGKIRDITIRVKSQSKGAINEFLKIAYDWYVDELQSVENTDRFLFDLEDCSGRSNGGIPNFRRYKLGDDKTFDSLFSQQCRDLLTIVDQFESKSGKYRIKGYPHKLGLLLTGPPGTGKTSLIKALAHYTGRHIVNVPLSRISTNASLMSLMFNKRYITNDSGAYSSLDFDRVIYVFEDVDASSDVVKCRKLIAEERAQAAEDARKRAALFSGATEVDANNETKPKGAVVGSPYRSSTTGSDSLNLMGLLNALDGVVDTPGRIVMMTTNHPEILDGALIRPGRIDKRLNLGYMIAEDMIEMIEHYFEIESGLDVEMRKRIESLIDVGLEMTAAELEQLAIEHDTVDDLVTSLEQRDVDRTYRTVISDSSSCTSDPVKT